MINMEALQQISNLSLALHEIMTLSKQETKSLEQMALKLSEETGEVCQALLSYVDANGSEYKDMDDMDVKEECADVIMVALSLFYKLDGDDDELSRTLAYKTIKWKEKSRLI